MVLISIPHFTNVPKSLHCALHLSEEEIGRLTDLKSIKKGRARVRCRVMSWQQYEDLASSIERIDEYLQKTINSDKGEDILKGLDRLFNGGHISSQQRQKYIRLKLGSSIRTNTSQVWYELMNPTFITRKRPGESKQSKLARARKKQERRIISDLRSGKNFHKARRRQAKEAVRRQKLANKNKLKEKEAQREFSRKAHKHKCQLEKDAIESKKKELELEVMADYISEFLREDIEGHEGKLVIALDFLSRDSHDECLMWMERAAKAGSKNASEFLRHKNTTQKQSAVCKNTSPPRAKRAISSSNIARECVCRASQQWRAEKNHYRSRQIEDRMYTALEGYKTGCLSKRDALAFGGLNGRTRRLLRNLMLLDAETRAHDAEKCRIIDDARTLKKHAYDWMHPEVGVTSCIDVSARLYSLPEEARRHLVGDRGDPRNDANPTTATNELDGTSLSSLSAGRTVDDSALRTVGAFAAFSKTLRCTNKACQDKSCRLPNRPQHMQIFAKTPDGKNIALNVKSSDTIHDVKVLIQRRTNISPEQQCLLNAGKPLRDEHTLNDYNIRQNVNLDVFVRDALPGGAGRSRCTRGAAQAQEIDGNEPLSPDVRSLLSTIMGYTVKPVDEWFVIPPLGGDMNTTEYPIYDSSRLLSRMIDCDAGDFATALYNGKKPKERREIFLATKFGVNAVLHRSKVVCINFRKGVAFDPKSADLSELPRFSLEPINEARKNLRKEDLVGTIESFIEDLKTRSRLDNIHRVIEEVLDVSLDNDAFMCAVSTLQAGDGSIETVMEGKEGSSPTNTEVSTDSSDGDFEVPIVVSPDNSNAVMISPSSEGDIETSAFPFDQEIETEEAETDEDHLNKFLEKTYPRNAKETIKHRINAPRSRYIWKPGEGYAKPSKDAKFEHVETVLHAASNQNSNKAAQILTQLLLKTDELNEAAQHEAIVFFNQKKNHKILKNLIDKVSGFDKAQLDTEIVNRLDAFSKALHSRGTLEKESQQAKDVIATAALYSPDPQSDDVDGKKRSQIQKRLGISNSRAEKAPARMKRQSGGKLRYHNDKRKVRKDSKRVCSRPYVYHFCHDETYMRASKVDTGESKTVRVQNLEGQTEKHEMRRWCEATNQNEIYEEWKKSDWAKKFEDDYPLLRTIGKTIFIENLCPCVRHGKKDVCADMVMSGLEEARDALERAHRYYREKVLVCDCAFHKAERLRVIPSLSGDEDSDDGDEDSDDDDESLSGNISSDGSDDESSSDEESENQRCSFKDSCTGCVAPREPLIKCSICHKTNTHELCVNQCGEKYEGKKRCFGCKDVKLNDAADAFLRLTGEGIICQTLCEAKEYPELKRMCYPGYESDSKEKIPKLHHLDCTTGACGEKGCGVEARFGGIEDCPLWNDGVSEDMDIPSEPGVGPSTYTKYYFVWVWESTPIARTDKKQKELVRKSMTMVELILHFKKCLEEARAHYVRYRCVDWMIDLYKYNTRPEHGRIVIGTDFSANPNLSSRRTATGAVDSHAVLAVFIVYSYKDDGKGGVECKKRSHLFIGSSESAGKKNNWRFHIGCLLHLVDIYQQEYPLKEVVVATDRCPGQYLCRQQLFQMSKLSATEGKPIFTHLFACVGRFKGQWDAEGGKAKDAIRAAVQSGKYQGKTALEFYQTLRSVHELNHDEAEMNKLHSRDFYYVTYCKDELEELNTGENEGHILYVDMDNKEDISTIKSTKEIYMVRGVPNGFTPPPVEECVDIGSVWDDIYKMSEAEKDEVGSQSVSRTEYEDNFIELYEAWMGLSDEEDSDEADAEYDFIQFLRGEKSHKELVKRLNSKSGKYMSKFLSLAGKSKMPTTSSSLRKNMKKWLEADPINQLYMLRSKEDVQKLYMTVFGPEATYAKSATKEALMSIIISYPLSPKKTKKEKEKEKDGSIAPKVTLHYIWRDDLPCGCQFCQDMKPDECVSPFKNHMKRRLVLLVPLNSVEATGATAETTGAVDEVGDEEESVDLFVDEEE